MQSIKQYFIISKKKDKTTMVSKSEHKRMQRKELTNVNIRLQLAKQVFSEDFSHILHTFSKEHCKEPLKIFKQSWKTWINIPEIETKIREETERIKSNHFVGTEEDIIEKMYISARFYYRKKEKRQRKIQEQEKCQRKIQEEQDKNEQNYKNNKNDKTKKSDKKKPYIGFSQEFIQLMDNEIKNMIMQIKDQTTPAKISQTKMMNMFTEKHIEEITNELGKLKQKYDQEGAIFISTEIAYKMKKSFQNRYYSICKILNNRL